MIFFFFFAKNDDFSKFGRNLYRYFLPYRSLVEMQGHLASYVIVQRLPGFAMTAPKHSEQIDP